MIKIVLLTLSILSFNSIAFANYDTELKVSLQEALMESNADYNKHKKEVFNQEHNRIDDWGSREDGSIMIHKTMGELQPSEYQIENTDADALQEVSVNDID